MLFFHLRLCLPSGRLHSSFPTKPLCATCPTLPILLYLVTRIIFGEEYRSQSSLLCSFLHSPVTLSLFDSSVFLYRPVLKQSQPLVLPQYERPSFTNIQNAGKIIIRFMLQWILWLRRLARSNVIVTKYTSTVLVGVECLSVCPSVRVSACPRS